jgi:acyl carrier protein
MPSFLTAGRETRTIERWLIDRVAYYLECPVADVDPSVPLAETGIDSPSAVGLCGDVEDHFQIEADATLVFDYPTIPEIATFITEQIACRQIAA